MTDEEIKLRCIEMLSNIYCAREHLITNEELVIYADGMFKVIRPYIKEGKLPD